MVKDRLADLKKNKNKSESAAIEIKDDVVDEKSKFRRIFERAEILGQWVQHIEQNNLDIRRYLRKVEVNHEKIIEDKLQSLYKNNTTLAQQVSTKFKEWEKDDKDIVETTENRIREIQFTTLKTRFQKAFLENAQLLEKYKNIQKRLIKGQLQAKGYFNATDEEVSLLLDEGTDIHVFTENILAETAEAKRILASVEERHQQLQQIEIMLTEVRDLFVQMAILIESQQELVDRIEYQAQAASDYIGAGAVELTEATKKTKGFRKKKIYFIIALVVILIIILILMFK